MVGLAVAAGLAVLGCLDAFAPGAPQRHASVGIVPVFAGAGALDVIPGDVDSIVVTVHHPPDPDVTHSFRILPGQDSIVITFDVPVGSSMLDTVAISMEAIRTVPAPAEVLYRADSAPIVVTVGQPTRVDTMVTEYVGPGLNIQAIEITPRSVAIRPGDSLSFGFSAIDSTGAAIGRMPALWTSRDGVVASIGADGVAHGAAEGRTWIVVTAGARASVKDSALVAVSVAPVATIEVQPSAVSFTAGVGGSSPALRTVAVTNGGVGSLSGLAVSRIDYAPGQVEGWLAAYLDKSSAPATLTLAPSTGSLPPGIHSANVVLGSALALNSPQSVAVTFTVTPVPLIGLSAATVSFVDTMAHADRPAQTVTLSNAGTGTLSGLAVGSVIYGAGATGWLTATLSGTAAPATLTLSVAKGALGPGVYTATVPVTSAAADNSPRSVTVTFDLRPQADIGLTPASLTFLDTVTTSDPTSQTVAVANIGSGALTGLAVGTIGYGSGQPAGWLAATLSGATAPATVTVTAAKGSLAPGVYSATIPVTGVALNSPRQIVVTFDVRPLPLIGLTPAAVTVVDTVLTADPAARTVAVANVGTGTLTGLTVGAIDYAGGSGWLSASLSRSTAPATLTLTMEKGSLSPGTYMATVPLASASSGNAPGVSVTFDVRPSPLVSTTTLPGFFVLLPGDTLPLHLFGFDTSGASVPVLAVQFASRAPAVATVNGRGLVTGVSAGTTVVVDSSPGASGPVLDSALIVVPTIGQAVAFATANGTSYAASKVGDTLHVLIGVDLQRVSGEKLGSYVAQLNWSPSVLNYVSTEAVPVIGFPAPTVNDTSAAAGQLGFGATDVAGVSGPVVGLVYIKFVVLAAGTSPLTFGLTELKAAVTLADLLPQALVTSGSVRVP